MKQIAPLIGIFLLILVACHSTPEEKKSSTNSTVVIRQSTDARTLNPVAAGDPFSAYLSKQLFQSLLSVDFETRQPIGVIVQSPPTVTKDSTGRMFLSYSIRKEAQFDNGDPITVQDVLFSLKTNIAPLVNNLGGAYYFDFIEDFQFDTKTPRNFTIVTNTLNVNTIFKSGDFSILPQKIYDSSRVMDNYTLAQLRAMENADEKITRFAEKFNEQVVSVSPEDYNGSGAYRLKEWKKGERIVLQKKDNWWGESLKTENLFFDANLSSIRYEIIPDPSTAMAALKSGKVDLVQNIPTREFAKLDSKRFTLKSPLLAGYTYIGFNVNDSILKFSHIREAIEASIPFQKIVEIIYQNQAVINRLPLAIQDKKLRNNQLIIQDYEPSKTKELLEKNGWKDTDENGILEKEINGEQKELRLNYHYNAENDERKEIGLLIKAELKKAGIELTLNGVEWTQYLKMLRQNQLQIFINGSTTPPLVPNFTSSFHSNSANGGRNYANYQSKEADAIIDQIKSEFDNDKRTALIHDFQRVINRDKPYLFLFAKPKNIAIARKFKHTPVYDIRPHFWAPEFN